MTRMSEKVVVVVGASSGMGRATARSFIRAGAQVVMIARREQAMLELKEEMAPENDKVAVLPVDVRHRDDVFQAVRDVEAQFGHIDVLVYATGTNVPARAIDVLSERHWQELLDVNVTGAFHFTQAVLPGMRERREGLILYISSVSAKRGDVSGVAYQASKRGMDGLAAGLMEEFGGEGVRASVIYPGLCDTPLLDKRPQPPSAEARQKALRPEDVADVCLFIASLPSRVYIPELVMVPGEG